MHGRIAGHAGLRLFDVETLCAYSHCKGSQSGRCIPKDQQAFPLEQRGEPNADPPGPTA
jgi:hypothetical protein